MKITKILTTASLLSFCALVAPSHAGLIGETVGLEWFYPTQTDSYGSNGQQVVGAGVEYPNGCCGFGTVYVDVSDSGFTVGPSGSVLNFSTGSFNGFRLDSVTGSAFNSVSYLGGDLAVVGVTVENGSIFANFAGQGVLSTAESPFAQFSFTLADDATAVPAPATLALLGLGLLGLRLRRKA